MIYKQRPDATACAEYDLWNKTMRRYVRRGSKGIALVDNTGSRPKLRYVFDVSDTGERENSRPVNLWSMREEYVPAVQDALERAYGVGADAGLDEQLETIASRLAAEYWTENKDSILGIVDDSFLYGYDEFNVGVSFRRAAETSIKYMLCSRCVEDPESCFEPEDFMDVFDFNTQAASNVLGTAVSEASSQVFREIERAIRTYERTKQAELSEERSKEHGRADLHEDRGLSDPGHQAGGDGGPSAGQVRQDAEGVPGGEQQAPLQPPDPDRETVPAPVGGAGDGSRPDGAADGGAAGGGPGAGQKNPADGLGAAHERAESTGGGDRGGGAYQQLTLEGMFPSEMEQITFIDQQGSGEKPGPFAMPKEEKQSISDDEIDRLLRHGSGHHDNKLRIAVLYAGDSTPADRAEYLKNEHGTDGGHSWQFSDGTHGNIQYRPQGLVIRNADQGTEVRLRWSEVEQRIGGWIEGGHYLRASEKARYADMERDYSAFGGIPLPAPGHSFPSTPEEVYERYLPVIADALLDDTAFRNAYRNNDRETATMEGLRAIDRAALTVQDPAFMRLYFDAPEYHDRFRQNLLDRIYEMLESTPEMTAGASHEHEMLTQAARMADGSNYAAPERFFLIETEGGYAVWDDIRDEIYVDPEGVSEEFTSEWQAEDYLLQVKEDVARREAADWLKTEEAKLPPLKYGIGDPFTIYSEDGTKEIVLTSITDGDVFYVYPDEPGRDQVFMDREMFEHSLRTGHIRDAQPKEAVQTAASYRSGDEAIVIQQYPNGQFYNHYGYDEQRRFAIATAGGFATFEEAETALRSHRPKAERVMEEPVPGTEAGQTPEGMAHEGAGEDITPAAPGTDAKSTAAPQEPTYQVGDTVYLEDTAYIVEEIGLFDVQLRDPTLAYPVLRAESKERLERMLWADVRNNAFLPGAKIEVTTPNYRVRVTVEETPVLEEQMGEAGISTARFVHENGDVTFSFAEADRDAVEHILSAQREEDPFADVEKWAADYQRQTQTAIAALEPGQRRIVDAMQTAGFFYDPLSNTALDPLIFRAGDLTGGYPTSFKTWDEAYAFIDGAELKDTPGLREQVQSVLHPDPTWAQNAHKLDVRPASDQVGPKPEVTATAETIYPGDKNGLPFDVVVERLHFGEPEHGQPEQTQQPAARNFRITDDHLGEGGPKAKFRANMDAINLLHELEFDGRDATPEEQEVLSRYVGWGGLADAFDEKKDSWAGEFRELYAALSPEEYAAARASTLNAHYARFVP